MLPGFLRDIDPSTQDFARLIETLTLN